MMPHRRDAKGDVDDLWDREIDAALDGLNAAQPAPQLQDRLHRTVPALTQGQRARPQTTQRRAWLGTFGAAATLVCACLLTMVALHGRTENSKAVPLARSGTSRAHAAPTPGSSPSAATIPVIHLAITTRPRAEENAVQEVSSRAMDDSRRTEAQLEAQALADTAAPSLPAPVLELTEQERKACLMMRRGERRNMAALDPAVQALSAEHVRSDFQHFFHPAPGPLQLKVQHDAERIQAGLLLEGNEVNSSTPQTVSGDKR